jgi:hypothetical protein
MSELIDYQREDATVVLPLKWFHFSQNNSGGYFINNEVVDEDVFIQATSAKDATSKAEDLFAPYSQYCSCCGPRWSYWLDDEDGHAEPTVYDEPIHQIKASTFRKQAKLHYYDGRVQTFAYATDSEPCKLSQ